MCKLVCATWPGSCMFCPQIESASGIISSLVVWRCWQMCECLVKQINTEATWTLMPSPPRIPKRQARTIALAKPGKDPHHAASYRPISLLSVCYKLLECIILQRISSTVEALLTVDQAGFHRGRSTCNQVTAHMTFIENGFERRCWKLVLSSLT